MSDQPSITVAELAERLGGILTGDGTRVIRAVATLEEAGPESLSWVGAPEFLPKISGTKAGAVLVPEGCTVPAERTIIQVADPDLALCEVLAYLAPPSDTVSSGIHPTAVVSSTANVEGAAIGAHVYVGTDAAIGAGTKVYPGVFVGAHTKIGRDCVLWPNVVVRDHVTIGDRVTIHPNSTIGADGFGYIFRDGRHRKIPQIGTVVIEDDVEIGANTAIDRARSGVTRIGRGTKLDNLCQIAHNCDIGEHCAIAALFGIAGSSRLGHHVIVGGDSAVIDHRRIGNGVQIAAGSLVCTNIPDGKIVRGVPAVDNHQFLREQATLRKVPKWIRRLQELAERVQHLEEQVGEATHEK